MKKKIDDPDIIATREMIRSDKRLRLDIIKSRSFSRDGLGFDFDMPPVKPMRITFDPIMDIYYEGRATCDALFASFGVPRALLEGDKT